MAPGCPPLSIGATESLGSLPGTLSEPRGWPKGAHSAAFKTQIGVTTEGKRTVFKATKSGNGGDNPKNPHVLNAEQRRRAVAMIFDSGPCANVQLKVGRAGRKQGGRGFMLSVGATALQRVDRDSCGSERLCTLQRGAAEPLGSLPGAVV